jgi:hypothetical protein
LAPDKHGCPFQDPGLSRQFTPTDNDCNIDLDYIAEQEAILRAKLEEAKSSGTDQESVNQLLATLNGILINCIIY